MCTSSGPGSSALAASWETANGLTNVHVWGDTTDYMFTNFCSGPPASGNYPSQMVVNLETMELAYFNMGGVEATVSTINDIIANADPCANL